MEPVSLTRWLVTARRKASSFTSGPRSPESVIKNSVGIGMNPRLIGVAGPLEGSLCVLPEGELSIGRDAANQLSAGDGSLSRRHCVVRREGAKCSVRDAGSRNGTRVNGVPVDEQQLMHGDQLSVGSSVLMFLSEAESTASWTNQVLFEDTAELDGLAIQFRKEKQVARRPEEILAGLPGTPELTRYLQSLLKIATGIGGIRDRESLQWQLLGFLFDVLPAERGAVLYFDKTGEVESTAAWDRLRGPEHAVPISESLVRRVYAEKSGLVAGDAAVERSAEQGVGEIPRARSVLCAPMMIFGELLGAIYLERSGLEGPFDDAHLQVITAVGSIAALALENLRHWERLKEENQTLKAEVNLQHNMVGISARMKEVFEFVRRVAATDATVLIEGESGTGKELVARAIHHNSGRAENPFVAINCAAIAENLLESELFGHEKGSFTGASAQKKGKIEMAEGGTLFLDEVSELAPELQAKLLRVLQEREFERVGGTRAIPLDTRLIAATNKKLSAAIEAGEFRKDLYYRLNVVTLTMPALRDRVEDIPQLAEHFLSKASRKCKTKMKQLSEEAMACLVKYDWPGNVRELENAIERAVVLGSGNVVLPDDLPEAVLEVGLTSPDGPAKYYRSVKEMKRQMIVQALQQAHGSYLEAAKALGIHPNSLLRLMRNLNVKASTKAGQLP
jgi:transcriptional regulator with GAF, ATPase, and Fis domain